MNHQATIETIMELARRGFGSSHAERIVILVLAGQDDPVSMSRLAKDVGVSRAAMTSIIERLASSSLIKTTAVKSDRRVKMIALNAKGRRAVESAEMAVTRILVAA